MKGCSFPGKPAGPVVQLRVLAAEEVDRTGFLGDEKRGRVRVWDFGMREQTDVVDL